MPIVEVPYLGSTCLEADEKCHLLTIYCQFVTKRGIFRIQLGRICCLAFFIYNVAKNFVAVSAISHSLTGSRSLPH